MKNPFADVRKFHAEDGVVGVIAVTKEHGEEAVDGFVFIPSNTASVESGRHYTSVGRGTGPFSWEPLDA